MALVLIWVLAFVISITWVIFPFLVIVRLDKIISILESVQPSEKVS